MRIYMFNGAVTAENAEEMTKMPAEEGARRTLPRENDEERSLICLQSEEFNRSLEGKGCFFVMSQNNSSIKVCGCDRGLKDMDAEVERFFAAIGVPALVLSKKETTFSTLFFAIRTAERKGYVQDKDELVRQLGVEELVEYRTPGIQCEEIIFEEQGRDVVYAKAKNVTVQEDLSAELDRVYQGKAKKSGMGHPVHYLFQMDGVDERRGSYTLLLNALYEMGRITSKRCWSITLGTRRGFEEDALKRLYENSEGCALVVNFGQETEKEVNAISYNIREIEAVCSLATRYCNKVLTLFCLPKTGEQLKKSLWERLSGLSVVEFAEHGMDCQQACARLKEMAKQQQLKADKKLLGNVSEGEVYYYEDLVKMVNEWATRKIKTEIYPQYKNITSISKTMQQLSPKGSAYDELMSLVGLQEAKKIINQLLKYQKAQKIYANMGLKPERQPMHMIFTGNPGTAKTTVARLFARIMYDNNLVSTGVFIEAGRADLVSKYIGGTAVQVKEKFEKARGGVLFIDEAYALCDGRDGLYGDEAINTIVQEMENNRDDMVVIFAGYPDKMEQFLEKNPGLRSRINFHLAFEDYSTEELCDIACLMVKARGMKLADSAVAKLAECFEDARKKDDFGNGRFVRNTMDKAKLAQAERVLVMDPDNLSPKRVLTIEAEDIEFESAEKSSFRKIGFLSA